MRSTRHFLPSATAAVLACVAVNAFASDWLQWGYDETHSGNNTDETTIDAGNVAQLTRRYQVTMSANANVAPVFASAIATPSGTKDLLFVTAQNGRLTAFDAADGSVVWSKDTSGTSPTESSPAIDPNRQFVYSYGIDGKVHKYAIGDGTETTTGGWPEIATLKPNVEKGASAIAFGVSGEKTFLYVVNNGYVGDGGDYQGHLTTIDLATGEQKVFNTLCSDITIHMVLNGQNGTNDCSSRRNGIWGRPGATYDPTTDRVYITTGNGPYNADTGGLDWGDSVLALNPDGSGMGAGFPVDAYAPIDVDSLESGDVDLGSASLTILRAPAASIYPHIGVETGKDSRLHLINLDDMSGSGAPGPKGGAIEVIDVPVSEFWMKTQSATWVDDAGDGATWVFVGNGSGLSGLKLGLDASNVPFLQPTWTKSGSATSTIIANDIVYHVGGCSGGNCIYARDPRTGEVLWTSPTLGGSIKWQSPILVNGALYVAAGTKLNRFDLGDSSSTHTVWPVAGLGGAIEPSTPQSVADGASASFTVTADAGHTILAVNGCGGSLAGNTYTTAAITADCSVGATFLPTTHIVTPVAGPHGSIVPSTPQTVDDGAAISFTLTPDAHYRIDSVTGCGGSLDGSVYTTGAITADCTVNATFVAITHIVTPSAGANGSIAPSTPQTVEDGATTTFTITPNAHYRIAGVAGCGGSLEGSTYTTGAITADCTVTATFEIVTHTVTPDAGDGSEGTIVPGTPQTVDDGDTIAFTITPIEPYVVASASGCNGELAGNVYTTGPVTADCTVAVSFTLDPDLVFKDGFDGAAGSR
jgi:outer membrane protein assembly factor BamB